MASWGARAGAGSWPFEASVARESTSSFQGWPLWALSWWTVICLVLAAAEAKAFATPCNEESEEGRAWAVQMSSAYVESVWHVTAKSLEAQANA
eukprot:9120434-Alexandrium_andersonii.AAC.1